MNTVKTVEKRSFATIKVLYYVAFVPLVAFSVFITFFGIVGGEGKLSVSDWLTFFGLLAIPYVVLLIGIIFSNKVLKGNDSKVIRFFAIFPFIFVGIYLISYLIGIVISDIRLNKDVDYEIVQDGDALKIIEKQ